MEEVRRGDPAAYGVLIDRYQERLYRIVLGLIQHREEALEVTQEIFVKAYQELEQSHACSTCYAWLCRVAVETCLHVSRTDRRASVSPSLAQKRQAGDAPADPRPHAGSAPVPAADDPAAHLYQAMAALPAPLRAAVVLRDIAGFTPPEIAEIMAWPLETVKLRVQQGRANLRGKLLSSTEAARTRRQPQAPDRS